MKRMLYNLPALVMALLLMAAQNADAQFTASGTVTDSGGEPLIGVSISVKGSTAGAVTDIDGRFSIELPGTSAVLEFSYVGYQSASVSVSRSDGPLQITMLEASTQLDEVIVTGLATNVKRSNLANSVASIDARELTGVTSQPTMDGALYGKFKGAEIRSNSGAPGGGMSVKLRGVTSIFGDQQPLYIIDGIYLDNSTVSLGTNIVSAAAGGGNTSTNQDDASNRIADIDPEDIESIEILKGASAAAIYGSRAAGGVVIIKTKRGRAGDTRVSLSQSIGFSQPTQLLGTRGWTEAKVREVFGDADANKFNQNGATDYEAELYDNTNLLATTRLEIYGGSVNTRYLVAGTFKHDDGIVDNTGYEKASLRLNVDHKFNDWLDLDVTSNYVNSTADRGFFNNGNTNTTIGYALAFTRPWDDLFPDEDGNYPANPSVGSNVLETVALITNREKINRFIGGATANVRLFTNNEHNLRLSLRAGADQYTLRTTGIFPQRLSFYRDPTSLGGVSISGTTVNTNT
ncbi:MAG: carboxypeptidase-like regulatory domain-containing protein, partial [Saprospiraceae bacterium]|nr:carboxypeptidase-like regulatory domain-containing protein [Saprospiraceae bacterium]